MQTASSPTRRSSSAHSDLTPSRSPSSSPLTSPSRSAAPTSPGNIGVGTSIVNTPEVQPRTSVTNSTSPPYSPPPTGHDLMRLFPPSPPNQFSENRIGLTSRYFRRQERAYFAEAGRREIRTVRLRLSPDLELRRTPPMSVGAPWDRAYNRARPHVSPPHVSPVLHVSTCAHPLNRA